MAVKCDVTNCKYNNGMFCSQTFVFLSDGRCKVPYYPNGTVRPGKFWVKGEEPEENQDTQKFENN